MTKYRSYKNKYTNSEIIHSIEDVIGMPFGDVVDRERELESQYSQIGIPTNAELKASPNAVYVEGYTKSDGTVVKSHWRSKPEGVADYVGSEPNAIYMQDNPNAVMDMSSQSTVENQEQNELPNFSNMPVAEPKLVVSNVNADRKGMFDMIISPVEEYNPQLYGHVETTKVEDDLFRKPAEPIKNAINYLLNNKIDFSPSKTNWEKIQEKIYTGYLKKIFPMSSSATENGVNNLRVAKNDENATIYTSLDDVNDAGLKNSLKEYGVKGDMRGVYYNSNSRNSKIICKSSEINDLVNDLCENDGKTSKATLEFKFNIKQPKDSFDRYASIQHAKIYNPHISEDGNYMEGAIIDISDFEKRPISLINIPNNWGKNMQDKGQYENYYMIIDIKVPLSEKQKEILRKKIKR